MTVSTDSLSQTESSFSKSMEVFSQIILFVFVAFRKYISGTDPHGHCFQNWLAGSAT